MKTMEYKENRGFSILKQGTYNGINYWIISLGTHPCAYLDVTDIDSNIVDSLCVHGGVTYDDNHLDNVLDDSFDDYRYDHRIIGWDYAHSSDYIGYMKKLGELIDNLKKWSTEEIFEEVKDAINQIHNG